MSAADDEVSGPVVNPVMSHVVTHVVIPPREPMSGAVALVADVTVLTTVAAFRVGRGGLRLAGAIGRALPAPPLTTGPRSVRARDDLTVRARATRQSIEQAVSTVLDRVVPMTLSAVLDRVDLTQVVRDRVDIDQLVAVVDLDGAVSRVDLDAIAKRLDIEAIIGRLDLVALTEEIMNALDIPEIIRESTTSVASGSVTEVRLQSISADEAVARVVDRFRLRRRPRSTNALPPPPGTPT
ncbi:hypothetical protein [Angustibacter luteus]|uniref:Uncharacterized protein n=1 Tax=Angustibacter luteus TaxID=658456 RepID=A0ABW1JHN9_9ACTN